MFTPTEDYRRGDYRAPGRPLAGLDAAINGAIGAFRRRAKAREILEGEAVTVDTHGPGYVEMSDHQLREKLLGFREQFRRGGKAAAAVVLPALAAIREAADRQLGLRPFHVQLLGALAFHREFLAEMGTGEGKTLTAGLAAVMAGWTKAPCHVITVNDYLVERDAGGWSRSTGFAVSASDSSMPRRIPRRAHQGLRLRCHLSTSKELLADFFRDRLQLGSLGIRPDG